MADTLEAPVETESNQIADDNGTISVSISADDLPPDPNTDPTNPIAEPVRPEGLPEKFKTVEDMIKAYGELEAKQGSIEVPVVPVNEARIKDPSATETPTSTPEVDLTTPTTDTPVVQKAIEDFTKLYVSQNGELTDANYKSLSDQGISRELVDNYIAGQQSIVENSNNKILESAGGSEEFNSLIDWASNNLSDSDRNSVNEMLENPSQAVFAVQTLKRMQQDSSGHDPQVTVSPQGGTTGDSTSQDVYHTDAELLRDQADPRYREGGAFTKAVEAKVGRSLGAGSLRP